jgi:hypothetical protein
MLARAGFAGPDTSGELALINWPRKDFAREPILDQPRIQVVRILVAERASAR